MDRRRSPGAAEGAPVAHRLTVPSAHGLCGLLLLNKQPDGGRNRLLVRGWTQV